MPDFSIPGYDTWKLASPPHYEFDSNEQDDPEETGDDYDDYEEFDDDYDEGDR